MYYTTYHSQYLKTGFDQTELMVYQDNSFLEGLEERVPGFDSSDLNQNKFKLYYKAYAMWTLKCQQLISSERFAAFAEQIMLNEEKQNIILKVTSYFVGLEYIITVVIMILNRQVRPSQKKMYNIGIVFCFLATVSLLMIIFIIYASLYR